MPIIDVHTHMFTRHWLELLRTAGDPYGIKTRPDGREEVFRGETPVVWLQGHEPNSRGAHAVPPNRSGSAAAEGSRMPWGFGRCAT